MWTKSIKRALVKFLEKYQGWNLIKNVLGVYLLQLVNFIFPLALIKILNSSIGIENYGKVVYVQAVLTFLAVIMDYGFNVSGIRFISLNRHSRTKLSFFVSAMYQIRLYFLVIILLGYSIYVFFSQSEHTLHLILSSVFLISQLFSTNILMQGLEKFDYLIILNFLTKALTLAGIYFFVNNPENFIYVNLLIGFVNMIMSLLFLCFLLTVHKISIRVFKIRRLKGILYEGFYPFISTMSTNTYLNASSIILGFFCSSEIIGAYSIAERIVNSIKQVFAILSQALFPKFCTVAYDSFQKLKELIFAIYLPIFALTVVLSFSICFFSFDISEKIVGNSNPYLITSLKILSPLPIIVLFNTPINIVMLSYALNKSYMMIISSGVVLFLVLSFILVQLYQHVGMAIAICLTEFSIGLALYVITRIKHRKYSLV